MNPNELDNQIGKLESLRNLIATHGTELILGLIILILGVIFTKWFTKQLQSLMEKKIKNPAAVSVTCNTIRILLLAIVISSAAIEIGAQPDRIGMAVVIICLIAIGIVVIFRPLLPTLPFKAGNVVKIGDLLGKIEATTILNTRLRTFDGKTFFVPNRKILDEIVINYHYTKTRRVKVNVTIRHDQDLLRAKQVLEEIMIADPRVLEKPSPQVYVLDIGTNGVTIGPRCWTNNNKFWFTKIDLMEKIKYRFDQEGIKFAHAQMDVHHHRAEGSALDIPDEEMFEA